MMFHTFTSQNERRKYGGSCFIEFQYCTMPKDTKLKQIVSVKNVEHWKNDSLYLHGDDMNEFWCEYSKIFLNGYYSNEEYGVMDMYGLNYYTPEQTLQIIKQIKKKNPKDSQAILSWLFHTEECNGFYLLGV